jgi:rRNA-processing protein FCF1
MQIALTLFHVRQGTHPDEIAYSVLQENRITVTSSDKKLCSKRRVKTTGEIPLWHSHKPSHLSLSTSTGNVNQKVAP